MAAVAVALIATGGVAFALNDSGGQSAGRVRLDISGPCDELEHRQDPRCSQVAATDNTPDDNAGQPGHSGELEPGDDSQGGHGRDHAEDGPHHGGGRGRDHAEDGPHHGDVERGDDSRFRSFEPGDDSSSSGGRGRGHAEDD